MSFEWDPEKAAANRRKHGVSFDEAETVFADPFAVRQYDRTHSADEDRMRIIGISVKRRLLAVAYTERYEQIRIISARKANRAEERVYSAEE